MMSLMRLWLGAWVQRRVVRGRPMQRGDGTLTILISIQLLDDAVRSLKNVGASERKLAGFLRASSHTTLTAHETTETSRSSSFSFSRGNDGRSACRQLAFSISLSCHRR